MSEGNWREAYARDFEAGIRRAQLSEVDTNYFLSSLTGELPPQQADRRHSSLQRLATLPSLRHISAKIVELRELDDQLQRRFRLPEPRATGVGVAVLTDPETPRNPVRESWLLLRGTISLPPIILTERPGGSRPPTGTPRRWRQPIRIAMTGNPRVDQIVAAAVDDLRRSIPGLPIDERSFPNPVGDANVFLDWEGVQCREEVACGDFDTWPTVRRATQVYDPSSSQGDVLRVLAFFGQLRSGRWVPRSDIVPLSAYTGHKVTAAWLRAGNTGEINTAVCTNVTGIGSDGTTMQDSVQPSGAADEAIRRSVQACLGAALGAPSPRPEWSIRIVPLFRELCCQGADGQAEAYDQRDMLQRIYR